jgi:hypothetical protein
MDKLTREVANMSLGLRVPLHNWMTADEYLESVDSLNLSEKANKSATDILRSKDYPWIRVNFYFKFKKPQGRFTGLCIGDLDWVTKNGQKISKRARAALAKKGR